MQKIDLNKVSSLKQIISLANMGAWFLVSHSGGKDSQAMYLVIMALVAQGIIKREKVVVIHADLPVMEWPGTKEHIKDTIDKDIPFITAQYVMGRKKSEKKPGDFFDLIRRSERFPGPKERFCTSDLKTGPIQVKMNKANGYLKTQDLPKDGQGRKIELVVECLGIRALESDNRAAYLPFEHNKDASRYGKRTHRTYFTWYPIFDWTAQEVVNYVHDNGQKLHWAYYEGMTRLSCSICIFSSNWDFYIASKHRPELIEKIAKLEQEIGKTMFDKPIKEKLAHIQAQDKKGLVVRNLKDPFSVNQDKPELSLFDFMPDDQTSGCQAMCASCNGCR